MTKSQIDQINVFRARGMGPTQIARAMNLRVGTVVTHNRRHPLPKGMMVCKNCGEMFKLTPGRKIRHFCSEACKVTWWNKHRHERKNVITKECAYCGKEFKSYKSEHRRYCSRECYHNSRNEAIQ